MLLLTEAFRLHNCCRMSKKSPPSVQDVQLQGGRAHPPKGLGTDLPVGEIQITSEHEDPTGRESLPGDVGITSKDADIGFAGGQQGKRTGPLPLPNVHVVCCHRRS